jgi:hypothetical protein
VRQWQLYYRDVSGLGDDGMLEAVVVAVVVVEEKAVVFSCTDPPPPVYSAAGRPGSGKW